MVSGRVSGRVSGKVSGYSGQQGISGYSGLNGGGSSTVWQSGFTLSSGSWSSNSYTLTITGIASGDNIDFGLPVPTTRTNSDNFANAELIVSGVATNTLYINAKTTPTSNIDIKVRKW